VSDVNLTETEEYGKTNLYLVVKNEMFSKTKSGKYITPDCTCTCFIRQTWDI